MNTLNALQSVFQSPALHAAAWGFASTFAMCMLMIITKRWHGALTMDLTDKLNYANVLKPTDVAEKWN